MHNPLSINNVSDLPRYFWHPSVVYVPDEIGGHRWWMAQTPFPPCDIEPYRDRYELPCIHYSDDGVNWESICNPIDDLTDEQVKNKDFMSDPHLIVKDDCLEIYYRLSIRLKRKDTYTLLFKRTSDNGYDWSERILVADLRKADDIDIWGDKIISPAIVWTGTRYECYYVDASRHVCTRGILKVISTDGIHWKKIGYCELNGYNNIPWHIDVQCIDGLYHMISYGDPDGAIVLLTSTDGLSWNYKQEILRPSSNKWSFYSRELYRSCLVKRNDVYFVYFSGANIFRSYIGLLKTKDWQTYEMVEGGTSFRYLYDCFLDALNYYPKRAVEKVHKYIKSLF